MAPKSTLPNSGQQVKNPAPPKAPQQQFNSPTQLPGATLPTEVGTRMANTGTWNRPSPAAPVRTPMPPPRPPGLGVPQVAANVARPPPRPQVPLPPPRPTMPAAAAMPQIYSPLQTGNVRGRAPPIYTAANLGPILNRLFGGGQT